MKMVLTPKNQNLSKTLKNLPSPQIPKHPIQISSNPKPFKTLLKPPII
jgi:hypothetical protein